MAIDIKYVFFEFVSNHVLFFPAFKKILFPFKQYFFCTTILV